MRLKRSKSSTSVGVDKPSAKVDSRFLSGQDFCTENGADYLLAHGWRRIGKHSPWDWAAPDGTLGRHTLADAIALQRSWDRERAGKRGR